MAPNQSAEIRFNPTATVMQFTGDNYVELRDLFARHGVTGISRSSLQDGAYVVIFMGQVSVMNEAQFRSAQGLV